MRDSKSGNALLIVATGVPALIDAAGDLVDVKHWYLREWELHYVIDQAGFAGSCAHQHAVRRDELRGKTVHS